jgi:alpha,alpha-trehalase
VPATAFSKKNCFPRLCRFLSQASLIAATAFSLIGQAAPHAPAIHPARAQVSASSTQLQQPAPIADIQRYIAHAWSDLTRSMNECQSLEDAKTVAAPVLYLPAELSGVATPPAVTELQTRCHIQLEHLPRTITGPGQIDPAALPQNGLLYLENPYVVPGGQFNEMYGWDSYFIIRGLLSGSPLDPANLVLAQGMVENFFFEIAHYGGVLNANRTYYLTRSQPPFLTSMILAVYEARRSSSGTARPPARDSADFQWLAKAYDYAVRDYRQWTAPPHLAGDTGLARYFDRGAGPVPEIVDDPSHYYRGVAQYFLTQGAAGARYLVYPDRVDRDSAHPDTIDRAASKPAAVLGPLFPVQVCEPGAPPLASGEPVANLNCAPPQNVALAPEFYRGDRSLRESGFDVTFRFGAFGADTHHFAPVCLNSLLYKTEKDLERISIILGKPNDARRWRLAAAERQARINKYLWDARRGLFFDYDFTTGARSNYEYAATFYPLWAGLASPQQAAAVARQLALFEQNGGLAMSRRESQAQWDYPYGWAPVHLLAVEGLRRYGYAADAARISSKFLNTVLRNFQIDGTIREKYDVVRASEITHISAGYAQNVIGFGWTNGVFLELWRQLPPALRGVSPQRPQ